MSYTAGKGQAFVVGFLLHADALGGDAEAGAVHQGHNIFDEAHLAVTAEFGLGVLVGELAGGAAVDAELVLDVAHIDAAVALVVDEHGEAAAVLCALLAAGEHKVDVAIAVGDEALHAVEAPAVLLLVEGGLEHDALQVGAGIGLGEVHAHGLAGADAGDVFLALLLAAELVEGVDAALQAPDVLEAGVGGADDFAHHAEDDVRQVQSAVAARHGDAVEAGLAGHLEVLLGLRGINHAVVLQVRPFEVDALGVGLDDVGGHIAGDFEHAAVVLDGVLEVHGGVVDALLGVLVILFAKLDQALHLRMLQVERNLRMVGIVISHNLNVFCVLCRFSLGARRGGSISHWDFAISHWDFAISH